MKSRMLFIVSLVIAIVLSVSLRAHAAQPNVSATGPSQVVTAPIYANGGLYGVGSIVSVGLAAPTAPVVTQFGTAGSTSYTYYCVAQDINANETVASSSTATTTGNATLTSTNYNSIFCPGEAGAVAFRVLKADTSHSLGICFTPAPAQGCSVVDQSTSAGAAYTLNTVNTTATLTAGFLQGSTNAVVSTSVETFFPVLGSGTGNVAATVGDATTVINRAAIIKNLHCGTYTILGAAVAAGGTSQVFALGTGAPGVAPTDSALTCTETTAQTTCADTTHTVQLAALSNIYFSNTPSGTPTATVVKCSADIYQ